MSKQDENVGVKATQIQILGQETVVFFLCKKLL